MTIHIWVPDYESGIGGIQTLSRFIVRALRDCLPDAKLHIFAKNDTSVSNRDSQPATEVSATGWWSPSQRTVAFTLKLLRCAWRERPDLIITTHVNFAPVAHWLQKLLGIPFLAIGHGVEVWDIRTEQIKRALRAAVQLLAVSECTQQRMAAASGIRANQIAVLPNTFDPEKFSPAPKPRFLLKRYGLNPDQPVILTIARLASAERYKGYDQVLRAFATVRQQFPNARYLLGGRGPDRARVRNLIRELDLREHVIKAGYIPEHELRAHYNLCDVFAMPSKGEGFGIVFLEALACGKPVVAGNKDGSVDAVLNGKLGVLVDPDNVDEISKALIEILSGRHSLKVLYQPEALRREIIAAYGYEKFVERVGELLRKVGIKK